MKRFEDFTQDDLWALRKEVSVHSLFYSDYRNSFGIEAHCVGDFFDGWLEFLTEEMESDGKIDARDGFFDYFDEYDTPEYLWRWFLCFDDFSWVRYEEEKGSNEDDATA